MWASTFVNCCLLKINKFKENRIFDLELGRFLQKFRGHGHGSLHENRLRSPYICHFWNDHRYASFLVYYFCYIIIIIIVTIIIFFILIIIIMINNEQVKLIIIIIYLIDFKRIFRLNEKWWSFSNCRGFVSVSIYTKARRLVR